MSQANLEHDPHPSRAPLPPTGQAADVAVPSAVPAVKLSWMDRFEQWIARLSSTSNFWHRVCSMVWLPYAFRSGIRMRRLDDKTFAAELPFRRFNRNWYNAMAGAALLGNAEIAGGMYIFGITGGEWTIVCKELTYKFLRPCLGPALYKVVPNDQLQGLLDAGEEFNLTVEMDVIQQAVLPKVVKNTVGAVVGKGDAGDRKKALMEKMASKDRRVGRVVATFHVTPQTHQKAKRGSVRKVG
ncbi:MAG: hypothetical protein HEQ23_07655 [Tepidisphaera sp.]